VSYFYKHSFVSTATLQIAMMLMPQLMFDAAKALVLPVSVLPETAAHVIKSLIKNKTFQQLITT